MQTNQQAEDIQERVTMLVRFFACMFSETPRVMTFGSNFCIVQYLWKQWLSQWNKWGGVWLHAYAYGRSMFVPRFEWMDIESLNL